MPRAFRGPFGTSMGTNATVRNKRPVDSLCPRMPACSFWTELCVSSTRAISTWQLGISLISAWLQLGLQGFGWRVSGFAMTYIPGAYQLPDHESVSFVAVALISILGTDKATMRDGTPHPPLAPSLLPDALPTPPPSVMMWVVGFSVLGFGNWVSMRV